MALPASSIIQITVLGVAAGQAVNNVLHYAFASANPGGFVSSLGQCLTAFRTAWRAGVLPGITSEYHVLAYRGVSIVKTKPDPNDPNKKVWDIGDVADILGDAILDAGGDARAAAPTFVAYSIRKMTGVGGKDKRGSARIGPIAEETTDVDLPNQLTPGGLTLAQNAAATIKAVLNAGVPGDTITPGIYSRTSHFRAPVGAFPEVFFTPLIDAQANTLVGSQVSRKQRASLGA